jgi:hypothetical protein
MKASYRLLQWTMLMGTAAIMATACVVTSGDGDDDDFFNGGEGGTGSSTAGTSSTEGGDGTTAGTTSGGSSTAGSGGTAGTTSGGSGGSASTYVPGVCGGGDEPTSLPSCAPAANDEGQTCKVCLKARCCTEWQTCYGDTPTSACGWGATEEANGQFDCIQNCYLDGLEDAVDLGDLQAECEGMCLNQCEDDPVDMGFLTEITDDLMRCISTECKDECFPATLP